MNLYKPKVIPNQKYIFIILNIVLLNSTHEASLQLSIKSIWTRNTRKIDGNLTIHNHSQQNLTLNMTQKIRKKDSATSVKQLSMNNINQTLKELFQLKHQCIVRNHIEDIETQYALDFVPNWTKILIWKTPARRSIEIRRQKWEYILTKHSLELHNLTVNLAECGMNRSEFCSQIAHAYFIFSHNLYVNEFGFNFNATGNRSRLFQHVRDPILEKSIQILMRSLPVPELEFKENGDLIKIPKELYIDLNRNFDHVRNLKWYYDSEELRAEETLYDLRRKIWKLDGNEGLLNRVKKGGNNYRTIPNR